MSSDAVFFTKLAAAGVAVLVVLALVIPAISSSVEANECAYTSTNSGAKTKFVKNHIWSWDCYVEVDGKWIPLSKWRGDEE